MGPVSTRKKRCIGPPSNTSKEAVIFKRFPGHTAEEMAYYAPKPLHDYKPDQVVIIAGTNSLTQAFYEKGVVDEYEIVESVMKILSGP